MQRRGLVAVARIDRTPHYLLNEVADQRLVISKSLLPLRAPPSAVAKSV